MTARGHGGIWIRRYHGASAPGSPETAPGAVLEEGRKPGGSGLENTYRAQ